VPTAFFYDEMDGYAVPCRASALRVSAQWFRLRWLEAAQERVGRSSVLGMKKLPPLYLGKNGE
jgi:hypothetical protein